MKTSTTSSKKASSNGHLTADSGKKRGRKKRKQKRDESFDDNDFHSGEQDEAYDLHDDRQNMVGYKRRKYSHNVRDKLAAAASLDPFFVNEVNGAEFNLDYIQRLYRCLPIAYSVIGTRGSIMIHITRRFTDSGHFVVPIFVRQKDGLGIVVPEQSFDISDVRKGVGGKLVIQVMDCSSQTNIQMSMGQFETYWHSSRRRVTVDASSASDGNNAFDVSGPGVRNPNKSSSAAAAADSGASRILNVISLEFSDTRLAADVVAPHTVRQIDWIDVVWPRHLKDWPTQNQPVCNGMYYPKVQKYCLMSVAGCYTDFHIDFGGSSVWYHVVRGCKVFWVIPPTEANLSLFQQWTVSGKQSSVFFADMVKKYGTVRISTGNTMFIPSGWIHAVYTVEDTIAFGGNFLHSYAIDKQIRVAQVEEATRVPPKFRFPFFNELHWSHFNFNLYALDKYVSQLMGITNLLLSPDEAAYLNKSDETLVASSAQIERRLYESAESEFRQTPPPAIRLTAAELFGLKTIVVFIHALPVSRKSIPHLLRYTAAKSDATESRVVALIKQIRWLIRRHRHHVWRPAASPSSSKVIQLVWPAFAVGDDCCRQLAENEQTILPDLSRRRIRCGVCLACRQPYDHDDDHNLAVIIKNLKGEPHCLQPLLHPASTCQTCLLDGWHVSANRRVVPLDATRPSDVNESSLVECMWCRTVVHPHCVIDSGVPAYAVTGLPSTWICPTCVADATRDAAEDESERQMFDPLPRMVYGADAIYTGYQMLGVRCLATATKEEMRTELAMQLLIADRLNKRRRHAASAAASANSVSQNVAVFDRRRPTHIVRPPPFVFNVATIYERRLERRRLRHHIATVNRHMQFLTTDHSSGNDTFESIVGGTPPWRLLDATSSSKDSEVCPSDDADYQELVRERGVMQPIFLMLSVVDLSRAAAVCRAWSTIIDDMRIDGLMSPQFRSSAVVRQSEEHQTLVERWSPLSTWAECRALVRRQPDVLNLVDKGSKARSQSPQSAVLAAVKARWMLNRLPRLTAIEAAGTAGRNATQAVVVPAAALFMNASSPTASVIQFPALRQLCLDFCSTVNLDAMRLLFGSGGVGRDSRLTQLRTLSLVATGTCDTSLDVIAANRALLTNLTHVDVSRCWKLGSAGVGRLREAMRLARHSDPDAADAPVGDGVFVVSHNCPRIVSADAKLCSTIDA